MMSEMEGYQLRAALEPEDVESWLRAHGWEQQGMLPRVASLWGRGSHEVLLPLSRTTSDFQLRWRQLFDSLAEATNKQPSSLMLEISSEGVDVTEWAASGPAAIDDTIPLADGETLISSARQAYVAAANATLQRRAYFGHSIPKLAREHARFVRMGQTRPGSYVVPIISRVPDVSLMEQDDMALFAVGEEPFERRVMKQFATAAGAVVEMALRESEPTRLQLNESVALGVSHELCDALAKAMASESVSDVSLKFIWARRFPAPDMPVELGFPGEAAPIVARMAEHLRGSDVVAEQTIRGIVIGLKRDEEEEEGKVTIRTGTGKHRPRVSMWLDFEMYDLASEAHRTRRPVSATGRMVRRPGRALTMDDVRDFGFAQHELDLSRGWE